ncbi:MULTISPECIES: DUF3461 family protein [Photobacterium]|uniref:UPF0325 protein ABT57_00245 n=1 Tax=Photobacterium ganghwense TaxID=320778 RepID=A0A0J1HJD8_9GAMM|nr:MULTISPECIES: DUF3461 family protein [Photobacterium]KLV11724.1 hypothetical protein ABT57_00245 [Photobacterium ganghwense]MBV1843293.1 DUF3461 family protein [Photobacterium ganghwense]PSU04584.1 hypothetical protein C9I92_23750 [Photobacterium ganghwense]QSV14633.1 DUF3461 family protein [Photobacterium ganghwense]
MYPNLSAIGIEHPETIERYSLRQEAANDILKIYFTKQKGELFAKSVKFKFPRQRKSVVVNSGNREYKEITEINRTLTFIIDELDRITNKKHTEIDIKKKILGDLRHLEQVVSHKIAEIEADLEKLK